MKGNSLSWYTLRETETSTSGSLQKAVRHLLFFGQLSLELNWSIKVFGCDGNQVVKQYDNSSYSIQSHKLVWQAESIDSVLCYGISRHELSIEIYNQNSMDYL